MCKYLGVILQLEGPAAEESRLSSPVVTCGWRVASGSSMREAPLGS